MTVQDADHMTALHPETLPDQFHQCCLAEALVVTLHVQECPRVEDHVQKTESDDLSDQLACLPSCQCLTCHAPCSGVLVDGRPYVR